MQVPKALVPKQKTTIVFTSSRICVPRHSVHSPTVYPHRAGVKVDERGAAGGGEVRGGEAGGCGETDF